MNLGLMEIAGVGIGVILAKALLTMRNQSKELAETPKSKSAPSDLNFNNGQPGVMIISAAENSLVNQRTPKEKGEPYPIAFDPVNDFLPRYRWPDGTVWSPAYNPVDSYRPLDYQLTTTLSEVVY
tara:strand:+ start:1307 stop:1681 length:375 start_codon:yes stop_codon:yes gene_type:complete